MTTRSSLTHLLLGGLLLGALATAGCTPADQSPGEGTVTSSPSPTSGESAAPLPPTRKPKPSISGPVVPPGAKGEVISVTGRVERLELEGGCTVLRSDGRTFQLIGGDPKIVQPGATVVVRGRVRDDISTTCMVGPVLEVLSAQRS